MTGTKPKKRKPKPKKRAARPFKVSGAAEVRDNAVPLLTGLVEAVLAVGGSYRLEEAGGAVRATVSVNAPEAGPEQRKDLLEHVEALGAYAADGGGFLHVEDGLSEYSILLGSKEQRDRAESAGAKRTIDLALGDLSPEDRESLHARLSDMVDVCRELGQGSKIFDLGSGTFDRYLVFVDGQAYGMSANASSPQGFNMHVGEARDFAPKSEKKVKDPLLLPDSVVRAVRKRIEESRREKYRFNSPFIRVEKSPSDIYEQLLGSVDPDPTEEECVEIADRLSGAEAFVQADERINAIASDLVADKAEDMLNQIRRERAEEKEETER